MITIATYSKIGTIVILIGSIIAISGALRDSYIPYIVVIILFWIHISVLYFLKNKKVSRTVKQNTPNNT